MLARDGPEAAVHYGSSEGPGVLAFPWVLILRALRMPTSIYTALEPRLTGLGNLKLDSPTTILTVHAAQMEKRPASQFTPAYRPVDVKVTKGKAGG